MKPCRLSLVPVAMLVLMFAAISTAAAAQSTDKPAAGKSPDRVTVNFRKPHECAGMFAFVLHDRGANGRMLPYGEPKLASPGCLQGPATTGGYTDAPGHDKQALRRGTGG